MVALANIRRWRPSELDAAFDALGKRRDSLLGLNDGLEAAKSPPDWTGEAAERATVAHRQLADRMEHIVAGVSAVRRAVGETSDAILALHRALGEAETLAGTYLFRINDDGSLTDNRVVCTPKDPDPRDRERARLEIIDRVEQVLRRAEDIDNDLAAVLRKAARGEIGDGNATSLAAAATAGETAGGLSTLEPPKGGTPGDNAGWWASLSEAERTGLLKNRPDLLGNLDGLPATVRDQANRARIPLERAALEAKIKDLSMAPGADVATAGYRAKLEELDEVEKTLAKGDRQLLVLDTGGNRLKAAIATGNVDTANHVAVFTPGMTSNVKDSISGYDDQMEELRRVTRDESKRYGDGGSVAMVTWIGYEAPQTSEILSGNSVALEGSATRGAEKLSSFLNGIDASRKDDPHLTALGHSYGSLTTGLALQKDTGVDDVVFYGSPGLGTDNINDMKVPGGHAYMVEADRDIVADFGRFGGDPSDMAGLNRMSSDEATLSDGRRLERVTGHSDYMKPNSTSQYNMAVVIAGLADRRVPHG
ncbi:alpha/beta hydrolase [Crossiella cryophila]|uniref:DUF1023 domain-containing protein n=1 Tax=Crossiella cryophila TaxID=43355 RepID=A0A7W7CCX9_9PSEU|nr:alpha/beta hydrolase [Crossiella cryophila]MBB4677224.1 hypothetical protein [Crossiella cryophila]